MKPCLHCIWQAETREAAERFRTELLELGAKQSVTQSVKTILFNRDFPVDIRHNAKIFREKLAVWAAEELKA